MVHDLSSLPRITNDHVNLTPVQIRHINAVVEISADHPDDPEFLHAILCQVGLPRSKQRSRVFERRNGNAAMQLEAGQQFISPQRGFKELPLPYGPKPRLILYHICSEVVRSKSKVIELGNSMACFLDRMNLPSSGAEYSRFRAQMDALCGVRMILGYSDGTRSTTINTNPISQFDAWTHFDERQLGFWTGKLEISTDFYTTLVEHSVPLDPRAIRALQHSALALDIYTWLAHRLCRVNDKRGTKLSWQNLKDQFGQEYKQSKDFKKAFRISLAKVLDVYPAARITSEVGGLRLKPSAPPISKIVIPGSLISD